MWILRMRRHVVIASMLLIVVSVALCNGTCSARLLAEDELERIQGAQSLTCNDRYYSYKCFQVNFGGSPTTCVGKTPTTCAGTCSFCSAIWDNDFCDQATPLNVYGCTVGNDPQGFTCGREYDCTCHLSNGVCACYSTNCGQLSGNNCGAVQVANYTVPCK